NNLLDRNQKQTSLAQIQELLHTLDAARTLFEHDASDANAETVRREVRAIRDELGVIRPRFISADDQHDLSILVEQTDTIERAFQELQQAREKREQSRGVMVSSAGAALKALGELEEQIFDTLEQTPDDAL